MNSNNRTNELIKWVIIVLDFVALNLLVWIFAEYHFIVREWSWEMKWVFLLSTNLALLLGEVRFSTIAHRRVVSVEDILRRVIGLVLVQTFVAYVLLKAMNNYIPASRVMLMFMPPFFLLLLLLRFVERLTVKHLRSSGRNTRSVTFIGNDPELLAVYDRLAGDETRGYRILGYYADADMGQMTHARGMPAKDDSRVVPMSDADFPEGAGVRPETTPSLQRLGTLSDFLDKMDTDSGGLDCGDELYVSLSRRDRDLIRRISTFCDRHVIRFYYVPVSVESLGLRMKKEYLEDVELFTTYEIPLSSPVNKLVKRLFDIMLSVVFLAPTAVIFPFVTLVIKLQSPGPIFFRQKRTGLDGREFEMIKFRSMHVNKEADKVQATKDDPRKFPFGDFMRKMNIDELPQFLNVLKGDMSIVGPRPHMLAHTEQYARLINKYMVRHFVKPGLTGWAQVTGFRGETKELWQMEGRVKRDIWYIEHWSIWLDLRIIWLTAKTMFVHDKNAY